MQRIGLGLQLRALNDNADQASLVKCDMAWGDGVNHLLVDGPKLVPGQIDICL